MMELRDVKKDNSSVRLLQINKILVIVIQVLANI